MRTIHPIAGFTLTVLLSGAAFGADPRLLNLVMPNPGSVAGINVTNAEITPFGQYVLTQMTSAMNQQLQAFIAATGFDPRQDVSEILAASSGSVSTPAGLVLATGTFPVSQITTAIAAKSPQLTVQTYGGATLITETGTGKTPASGSIAFLGTTIAIAGDTASVKAAIDRSTGVNSLSPALTVQIQTLSTTEDAWVITDTPMTSLIPGLGGTGSTAGGIGTSSPILQMGQIFNSIQASSGGILFGSTVQITGQALTTDAASASSLASVLQALVSIASMVGGQNPEAASIAQLLQGLKVTTDGSAINVALSIPETQLETVLNGLKNQVKPAAKAAIRPAVALGSSGANSRAQAFASAVAN
jgi:hypothetical protein